MKPNIKQKLVQVEWLDAHNNNGAWMNEDELLDFAKDQVYRVTQVGYVVYEDDDGIVLASRITGEHKEYGQSFGQVERIPLGMVSSRVELSPSIEAEKVPPIMRRDLQVPFETINGENYVSLDWLMDKLKEES